MNTKTIHLKADYTEFKIILTLLIFTLNKIGKSIKKNYNKICLYSKLELYFKLKFKKKN